MPRYRVLIVDDQRDIRRVLSMGLSTLEMKVDVVDVPSAEEAMLVAIHGGFDLMVSDVRLPGMSGLDLVRRVKKVHPGMKIILMTGVTDPSIRQEVEAAGADAFFYKPIELEDFLRTARHNLEAGRGSEPEASSQDRSAPAEKPLAVVDRLEDMRRKAVMGMAAILNTRGEVVAQAGFLSGVYEQPGLAAGLASLYSASLSVSQTLHRVDPENLFYLAGNNQYFYIVSVNGEHLLVLTAEQPFKTQIEAFNQWLPGTVRELDQLLAGRPQIQELPDQDLTVQTLVGESETLQVVEEEPILRSLEEEIAEVEISEADQAAIDSLFSQAGIQQVQKANLDDFWENLAEESESLQKREGAISFDEALSLGLTSDEHEEPEK
jgi:CheY-like chemotaxis protein